MSSQGKTQLVDESGKQTNHIMTVERLASLVPPKTEIYIQLENKIVPADAEDPIYEVANKRIILFRLDEENVN